MAVARQQRQWLAMFIGVVAALTWIPLGLRVVAADGEPSGRALFAWVSWVLAGFAVGAVTWMAGAPRRAKRPDGAVGLAETPTALALLGIMLAGQGATPILDPATSAWGWGHLIAGSLVGGLSLGVSFMGFADPARASAVRRPHMGAPQSGS